MTRVCSGAWSSARAASMICSSMAPPPTVPRSEPSLQHHHLRAGLLRRAARALDDGGEDERLALGDEGGDLRVELHRHRRA